MSTSERRKAKRSWLISPSSLKCPGQARERIASNRCRIVCRFDTCKLTLGHLGSGGQVLPGETLSPAKGIQALRVQFLRFFTFVVYRASGWTHVGTTQGRERYDTKNLYDKPQKDTWLRPLRKDWKRILNR